MGATVAVPSPCDPRRSDICGRGDGKDSIRHACQALVRQFVNELTAMRQKLETTASARSLKRGPGGIVDIEFVVQLLQLKNGRTHPEILQSNLWDALNALQAVGLLSDQDATDLREGYSFLRLVEARLRIVTDRPLTEVPEREADQAKLAGALVSRALRSFTRN